MSLTLQIKLPENASTARTLALALEDTAGLNQAAADRVAQTIRGHFTDLSLHNHKTADDLSATPTDFWNRMRSGTRATATATEGSVAMPREVAQRYFGGTLKPTGGKHFLAIPAVAEAYGKKPQEFTFLTFGVGVLAGGVHAPALLDRPRTNIKIERDRRKGADPGALRTRQGETVGGAGTVYYWLVRQATQKADPSVLPPDAVLETSAQAGVDAFLRHKAGGAL